MDTKKFQLGKISIEIEARTIDFWRGEYAKRRVFIENRENYTDVENAIAALRTTATSLYNADSKEFLIDTEQDYEIGILNSIANSDIEYILSQHKNIKLPNENTLHDLQLAYNLSRQYGYVISDLSITSCPYPRKYGLLLLVQSLDEEHWDKISHKDLADGQAVKVVHEKFLPRFYGPKACPWHRTHLLAENKLLTAHGYTIEADISFAVCGIFDDEFHIRSTVGMIEEALCIGRTLALYALLEKLHGSFSLNYSTFLEKFSPEDDAVDVCVHNTTFFDALCASIPSEEGRQARVFRHKYLKIESEISALYKKRSDARKEMLSGPYRGNVAEVSRAKGLYLWDTVYLEGKTRREALEELKMQVNSLGDGVLFDDNPKDNKQIKRLTVTDECIRDNRFLPMS